MAQPFYFGINPPFFGGPQNILSRQTDEKLIKNDILQSILTIPGERVYRPTYGTGVRAAVFEQDSDELQTQLTDQITAAVALDERVTLQDITFNRSPDEQTIRIRIVVVPNNNPLERYIIEVTKDIATTTTVTARDSQNVPGQ